MRSHKISIPIPTRIFSTPFCRHLFDTFPTPFLRSRTPFRYLFNTFPTLFRHLTFDLTPFPTLTKTHFFWTPLQTPIFRRDTFLAPWGHSFFRSTFSERGAWRRDRGAMGRMGGGRGKDGLGYERSARAGGGRREEQAASGRKARRKGGGGAGQQWTHYGSKCMVLKRDLKRTTFQPTTLYQKQHQIQDTSNDTFFRPFLEDTCFDSFFDETLFFKQMQQNTKTIP